MRARLHRLLVPVLLGTVAGLALAQAGDPNATVAPNANLVVQGIPAIPQSLAEEVVRYNDFRGHNFVDWHPKRREMLVSHRRKGGNTAQLYRLTEPMGQLEQLTFTPDPVSSAEYEPRDGRYIVFARATGGNEVGQLYRLALDTPNAEPVLLTNPDERNSFNLWLRQSGQMVFSAVPVDRTAAGGTRAKITTSLYVMDPEKPQDKRKLGELEGGGWSVSAASNDEKQLVLRRYLSANESQVWLMDVASGQTRQLLPAPEAKEPTASYHAGRFSPDGRKLWIATDRFGEFTELARLDIASGTLERLSSHIPWDVSALTLTEDGKTVAAQFNVDGRDELRLFDGESGRELPAPKLPPGNVGTTVYDRVRNEIAFTTNGARGPSQIYSLSPAGKVEQWTQAATEGVDTRQFSEQSIVRWKSFDGMTISGLLSQPSAARFPGRRPVIISIHGGPEAQATVGFIGRNNYYVNELGIALIQPNVRGSTGYGKSFLAADNGFKREDSVKDVGALLDWIATQPHLDPKRVLVMGGSYGGYMTLAVATHYADRIAGAIDIVGISHFLTFLQNTESYRRDLRRVEYGDERDPAMREFLERISPLTNAAKIKKPLFVVQGKNDPRVPYTEAEQIVAKVRESGTPVWYLRAENEGHGFVRKENQDYQFLSTILFLQQTLLK